MADYRARLTLAGPIATPVHSGTLFGHLCWALRLQEGEESLARWLAALPAQPFLISDAFPANCLPRPVLAPAPRSKPMPEEDRASYLKRLEEEKRLRKLAWMSISEFLELRANFSEDRWLARARQQEKERQEREDPLLGGYVKSVRQAHNTIDRLTGATPEEGGLYFMEESWYNQESAGELDAYVRTELSIDELATLFNQVGELGFGRDASLGRGQFTTIVEAADEQLFNHAGNRLLSLSHGALTANMADSLYKLHTHYGKLGGLYAGCANPFKYPMVLAKPGATFTPTDDGPYGALLSNVHRERPEVLHNAWHLCLPFTAV